MSLPPREHEEGQMFSQSDVQHIVAREMAKQQIVQLQDGQLETNKKLIEMTAMLTSRLETLAGLITSQQEHTEACKIDLRREIKEEYLSRIDSLKLENRIEDMVSMGDSALAKQISALDVKMDKQWLRITIPIATLVGAAQIVLYLFTVSGKIQGVN